MVIESHLLMTAAARSRPVSAEPLVPAAGSLDQEPRSPFTRGFRLPPDRDRLPSFNGEGADGHGEGEKPITAAQGLSPPPGDTPL